MEHAPGYQHPSHDVPRLSQATRDSSDAALSRARIHEKHQKKRRKERTQRGAKLEDKEGPGEPRGRGSFSRENSGDVQNGQNWYTIIYTFVFFGYIENKLDVF